MIKGACLCGAVKWTFEGPLESVTACNCTACRRYGTLWAYGHEGHEIKVSGKTSTFERNRKVLGFHFCATCGCVAYYRVNSVDKEGKRKTAVNVRMAENPEEIQHLPIDHFDGFDKFDDLPRDGRCVKDLWF